MTKEKLAKLRGMGLVFDDAFDELADTKEPRSIANDLAIVLEGNPEPPPNLNQLYYHTYFNKDGALLIQKYLKDGLGNTKGSFNDTLTDINIYYEDGSTDDAFGTICYVCMSKKFTLSHVK